MTDLVLVDCYLPQSPVMPGYYDAFVEGTPAVGLMISVSNDGERKSDKNLTFISYDSACMSCNVSSGCYVKVSVFVHQLISVFGSRSSNWHIKSFVIIALDTLHPLLISG